MSDEITGHGESSDERRRRLRRERKRRYLERIERNRGVALVEFTEAMLDVLVAEGALLDAEAGDRVAIGRAISRFVASAMGR